MPPVSGLLLPTERRLALDIVVLRRSAITRVYNEALANADSAAEVMEVIEDKKRGLVARLVKTGTVSDDDVVKALGAYTRPWEWAE